MHVFASTVWMQTTGFASFPHSLSYAAQPLSALRADLCVDLESPGPHISLHVTPPSLMQRLCSIMQTTGFASFPHSLSLLNMPEQATTKLSSHGQ